jgi:hypothetical protein
MGEELGKAILPEEDASLKRFAGGAIKTASFFAPGGAAVKGGSA